MTERTWLYRWMRRPVAVVAWAVALLLAGSWAATKAPVEWVPTIYLPSVTVSAFWGDASPRSVERYVTAPIERAIQRVPGTVDVTSLSETGHASVTVDVDKDVDLGRYVLELNEQLRVLRDVLPDRVRPQLTKQIPREFQDDTGFLTLQLIGPMSLDALRKLAEEDVAPRIRSVGGVADVEVSGGTRRELLVTLDPDRLSMFGLSPDDVRLRLMDLFQGGAYGSVQGRGTSIPLVSRPESRLEALRTAVIEAPDSTGQFVRLADVADVTVGPEPVRSISRIDGQPVVTLTVDRTRGSHMLQTAGAVLDRIHQLQASLPEGVRLLIAADRTEEVRGELRDLSWRGTVGLLLVIVALLFMLRSVRAAVVVLFAVAVSMATAFLVLIPLEMTLNKITIAGLVLLFGLIVDNAVVVVEQLIVQRDIRRSGGGVSRGALDVDAAVASVRAVWLPLVGGTLTTVIVMLPLVYLSKDLRTLFLPFGILVSLTMATSLAGAGLLVPVLGRFLPEPRPHRRHVRARRIIAVPYRWAARHPKLTLSAFALVIGMPLWLLPGSLPEVDDLERLPERRLATLYNATVGADVVDDARKVIDPALGGIMRPFTREVDFGGRWSYTAPPTARVYLRFPPGNTIERADSLIGIFEQTALTSDVVERTIVRAVDRNANLEVYFPPEALRTPEPYLVRENLIRRAVGLAGIDVSVSGLVQEGYYSGSGYSSSGMTITAYGPSYDELERVAYAFGERLKQRSRRVVGVTASTSRYGREDSRDVLVLGWSQDASAASGVPAQRVAAAFRPVFTPRSTVASVDVAGEIQLPLRLELAGADAQDIAVVMDRPLNVGDSLSVRLAGLASYEVVSIPAAIERENQQYKRYIQVDYRGPYRMGNDLISEEIASTALPPGYRLDFGGGFFFTTEVKEAFGWVLLATLLLIYLATAAVFESWGLPLLVLLSVPTAAIGVAAGFLLTDAAFTEGAFIGVVLLVGIAVNDSILLADLYRRLRQARPHGARAPLIRLAVRERLRPMWTTTLTTVASLLPLLLFPEGDEFWTGLAVTVIGGLVASTLLAPVATVAMVSLRPRQSAPANPSLTTHKLRP